MRKIPFRAGGRKSTWIYVMTVGYVPISHTQNMRSCLVEISVHGVVSVWSMASQT